MLLKVLLLFLFSFNLWADCGSYFKPSIYLKRKIRAEYDLQLLNRKNLNLPKLKKYLDQKKVAYETVTLEQGRVLRLTGEDNTQLGKLVRHAQNYDTEIFIDLKLDKTIDVGYFELSDDFARQIFLAPGEIFVKTHESYTTLIHELRHARYDFLRQTQVDSFYHGSLQTVKGSVSLALKNHSYGGYTEYFSLEELPLFIKDLHSDLLSAIKMKNVGKRKIQDIKYAARNALELHERASKNLQALHKGGKLSALNDGESVSISLSNEKISASFTSFEPRLLKQEGIRPTSKNHKLLMEVLDQKIGFLARQNEFIQKNLKALQRKLETISNLPKEQVGRALQEALEMNKRNLRLIKK